MKEVLRAHIKPYIQPFERRLALAELEAIAGAAPVPVGAPDSATIFNLPGDTAAETLQRRLAYWERIGRGAGEITVQTGLEATSLIARNGVRLQDLPTTASTLTSAKIPNKRCLRYGPHGVHEYRGKFFPQLVRSLINIAGIPDGGLLADPMCGSGTSLVEGVARGICSVGLDLNPLSVFVTRVKCALLGMDPARLIAWYERVLRLVGEARPRRSTYRESLSVRDREYVEAWFDSAVLDELDCIQDVIATVDDVVVRDFHRVVLSNILREVSFQKTDDLRVRRDPKQILPGVATRLFLNELESSTKAVVAYLAVGGCSAASFKVLEHDARNALLALEDCLGKVDAIVMSPPYATALPYLDTDRLSLSYLNLLPRAEHRSRDYFMIGNREVTESQRRKQWERFKKAGAALPESTRALIEKVHCLNSSADVGFRRKNMAALLASYFFDMQSVLQQIHVLLKDGGRAYLVVGNNRTTAGGEELEISTALHLRAIAADLGFRVNDPVSMDMLMSRDIFRKNAMPSEEIISLSKI